MEINKTFEPLHFTDKRFIVKRGGAGSGKSYETYQRKVLKCVKSQYFKGIMLRKNLTSVKDSIFDNIISILSKENILGDFHITTHPLSILHYSTGNRFIFRGMKDARDREKVKSIFEPTDIVMEEANEFEQGDFSELNRRLRGDNTELKQIELMFNPVDEEHWLKDAFFDNPIVDPDKIYHHHSTYKDNLKFLDQDYINTLEDMIREDENLYRIYVLGEWGTVDNRGRIYKRYEDKLAAEGGHLYNWTYKPYLPIILACDFNVDPMKWALIQNENGIDYVFDEVVQTDTDTERMVQEVLNRYGKVSYEVFGDYSGTFRHTSSPSTDYQIIKQYLPGASVYVQSNPPVIDRINSLNWRLRNKEGKIRLFVNEKCANVRYGFKKDKFKDGKREEDKSQEKYKGNNPLTAGIHITSAIGYYTEYKYSLKGKTISRQW